MKKLCVALPIFMLSIALAVSCSSDDSDQKSNNGDGIESVAIGNQVWMKKNLNVEVAGSECYDNLQANCDKYGRLYDWETALTVCPSGWHLPTNEEWETLINFAGGEDVAGKKLKAKRGWHSNGNGADEFGFAALPGGYGGAGGIFDYSGKYGYWWSASWNAIDSGAYGLDMDYSNERVFRSQYFFIYYFSVRCLKD